MKTTTLLKQLFGSGLLFVFIENLLERWFTRVKRGRFASTPAHSDTA
jgi:hypothetical protein